MVLMIGRQEKLMEVTGDPGQGGARMVRDFITLPRMVLILKLSCHLFLESCS